YCYFRLQEGSLRRSTRLSSKNVNGENVKNPFNWYCDLCYDIFSTLAEYKEHKKFHKTVEAIFSKQEDSIPDKKGNIRKEVTDELSEDSAQSSDEPDETESEYEVTESSSSSTSDSASDVQPSKKELTKSKKNIRPQAINLFEEQLKTSQETNVKTSKGITKINPWSCRYCGMKIGSPCAIVEHLRVSHSDERGFKCTSCPNSAFTFEELRIHLRSFHDKKFYPKRNTRIVQFRYHKYNVVTIKTNLKKEHEMQISQCMDLLEASNNVATTPRKTSDRSFYGQATNAFISRSCYGQTSFTTSFNAMMDRSVGNIGLSDVAYLDGAVDDTDNELFNLLVVEDECSALLQNINSEHFDNFIIGNNTYGAGPTLETLVNDKITSSHSLDKLYQQKRHVQDESRVMSSQKNIKGRISTRKFKCDQCGKSFTTKKLIRYHLMNHFGLRPFSCDVCEKTFRHRYEVTIHKRCHSKPTFQCDICSKMFIHKSHLNVHRRKHTRDYVSYCNICNKGFISETAYKHHKDIFHDDLLHVCEVCGARLRSVSSLNEHILTHEPNYHQNRRLVCHVCGKTFLTDRNLRGHLKSHNQPKKYVCTICGKALSGKKVFEDHMKMHGGDKNQVCPICGKGFTCANYLTVHLRSHTGEKPYQCKECKKSFTQRSSLTVHMRSHTGQRPYRCRCGKTFVTKSHLMNHYKSCTNCNISGINEID
ncbi:putative uncharacterized zinc finger protein 814, partial [Agrilus planipennis]|uniref:Uncharacterized zinc finger protein 814 n=1 Tax=Agrilus planipennis TaxID=224129 RepID=A0A1W4XQ91_AGRPL